MIYLFDKNNILDLFFEPPSEKLKFGIYEIIVLYQDGSISKTKINAKINPQST